jgi:hypothetical protein
MQAFDHTSSFAGNGVFRMYSRKWFRMEGPIHAANLVAHPQDSGSGKQKAQNAQLGLNPFVQLVLSVS